VSPVPPWPTSRPWPRRGTPCWPQGWTWKRTACWARTHYGGGGEEVHAAVIKALGMLGLGRKRVVRVPADSQGRMRADALHIWTRTPSFACRPGNVNTGAFDPAAAICPAARAAGRGFTWTAHSDSGPLPRSNTASGPRDLTRPTPGDGRHKWPNVGYDCGIALVRDPNILKDAMSIDAAYLALGERREPSHYNPEMSRRARELN